MLEHVLVPIDGSEVAERALDYARKILVPDGKITLLTAVDIPEYAVAPYYPIPMAYDVSNNDVMNSLVPQANSYLQKTAESLIAAGYAVGVEAVIGEAAQSIVERADALEVDAIVMSTHGRSGITRWLLGSVANKVLNSANCPVFIVPVRRMKGSDGA
ncbi:MAG: universal stress protein [Anaerolineae bacterium]